MQIGLALSGGGFRAAVFHLGVLSRLAAEDLLQYVNYLSTVSGGSLIVGLVYHTNDYRWPSPTELTNQVIPAIARQLTETNLQGVYLQGILRNPLSLFRTRANDVGFHIRTLWQLEASLQDLPDPGTAGAPHWDILSTCYQTGKLWYFNKLRMGDYRFGYSYQPDFPLSDALAASVAVPGVIGPLALNTAGFEWVQFDQSAVQPAFDTVHLWDGGVYDNLGLEPLTNYNSRSGHYEYRKGVDFLIVSDAAHPVSYQLVYPLHFAFFRSFIRVTDVMMDQVRGLRSRATVAYFKNADHAFPPGRYFQIDNSAAQMLKRAYHSDEEVAALSEGYFPPEKALELANMDTNLAQLTPAQFSDLYRHGFEIADVTLHAFDAERFRLIRYDPGDHPLFQ